MDANDLNLDAVLRAPDWAKAVALLVLAGLIGGASWWFVYKPQMEEIARLEEKVAQLTVQYKKMRRQVANLPALRKQYSELEKLAEKALKQLPDSTQMARWLEEVNRVGRAEGLTFDKFRFKKEKDKKFYAEKPVDVEVLGSFNSIGRFLAATASLPRIVHITDLKLKGAGDTLVLKCQAKTFSYLGEKGQ